MTEDRPTPPVASRRPVTLSCHGVTWTDDYAWLRAANWQDVMRRPKLLDAEIRAYLEAENAYTDAMLADTVKLQKQLFREMKGRIKEDDSTVPAPDGPWSYYTSYRTGEEYPRLCRMPRDGGPETVMLDGNREAEGSDYWDLGEFAQSPDHRLLAYSVDDTGSELNVIRFRDLATGKDLPDRIPNSRDLAWANDSRTLFYVRLDENHRPMSVWRHTVGTPAENDVLIYEETNIGFYVGLEETHSHRYVLIDTHDHETNEVRLLDADHPELPPVLVEARQPGHEYSVEHHGDRLIIHTNSGGAEDFRVVEAPVASPGIANWRDIVPHRPGRLIIEAVAFAHHLVRMEREEGLPRIVVRRWSDGAEHAIDFPEEAYALGMSTGFEFDTTTLRFVYSSMTTPAQVYDYDMEARTRVLRKTQEVPSGHDPADYVTRRVYAPTKDGELVPVTLLWHRTTPLDGSAPLLLYGYGSYGMSMPAAFSTTRLSLVDRGMIFALAHVRGGKDKGYRWYREGKRLKKMNTFTDFIAAGEFLASSGYTRRGRIVANGASAGGMLMGVVANMAPDLFLAIIADVPFVDVLNTMLDKELPLTPPEWPEWGNPIESREDFEMIRSYAPYENVRRQAYPHIFAYAGLTDPRVTYWEPAKWIAKLRANNTSDNLILLKTNMAAGHGGASGRFDSLKEIALDYAFALKVAGLAEVSVARSRGGMSKNA